MGGWSDTVPAGGVENMMFSDALARRQQQAADWGATQLPRQLFNTGVRVLDSTAASAYSLLPFTDGTESFAPESWQNYHRNRATYDTITAIPMLFTAVGLANRGLKVTGSLANFARSAGMSPQLAGKLFTDLDTVREVDTLMGAARLKTSTSVAALTGRTVPGFDMTAQTGARLAKYGKTYAEVARNNNVRRTVEAIKEGVGQELAIFSFMNANEFLYPENGTAFSNLLFAGAGVGLNVGIEHAVGRAAIRSAISAAGRSGAEAALATQQRMFTEGQAVKGVVGEEWQTAAASLFSESYLENLERAAPHIAAQSDGLVSQDLIMSAYRDLKKAAGENLQSAYTTMFANRSANETLRSGFGNNAAVSRAMPGEKLAAREMAERGRKNIANTIGLAELVDNEAAARAGSIYTAMEKRERDLQYALKKATDPKEVAQIEADLVKLNAERKAFAQFRVGTIEPSGVVNFSETRKAPAWETSVRNLDVRNSADSVALGGSVPGGRQVHLTVNGTLEIREGFGPLMKRTPVSATDLNYDEITALQMLVGKVTKSGNKSWTERFWQNFAADPNMKVADLPFPVLDALTKGKLQLPTGALAPKLVQLKGMIDGGQVQNAALAAKLEWAKKQLMGGGADTIQLSSLDAFDFEKALNLGLTTKTGGENGLMAAIRAYANDQSGATAAQLLAGQNANEGLDRLLEMGMGYMGHGKMAARDLVEQDFFDGLRAGDNLDAHEKIGGIGAIYHRIDLPSDTEMQVAKIAALRNNFRLERLGQSQNNLVKATIGAVLENDVALRGVKEGVYSLIEGATSGRNALAQTTFATRFSAVHQHAHAIGQRAQKAVDRYTAARLEPILRRVKALYASPQRSRVFAEFSAGQSLVSRGASLTDQYWKPGLNELDMSRPGAKHMLKMLGDLKGAPADGDPWHVFDLSIAANEGRYVPVEISDEAASLMNQWTDISYEILEGINTLRNVNGLPEIDMLYGHMPVMDANRYEWRFIQDVNTGRVTGSVRAKTAAEADRLQTEAIARLNELGTGNYAAKDVKDIADYHDAIDSTFLFRLNDYSGIKQTGASTGRSADFRLDISGDLFEEMAISVRNTFGDIKDRTITAYMSDVMSTAQMMNRKMKGAYGSKAGPKAVHTPVETFMNLLLASDRHPPDSLVRKGHDYVESVLNATIGKMADALPQAWRVVDDYLHGNADRLSKSEQALAEQALANYKPMSHLAADPNLRQYLKIGSDVDPYRAAKTLQVANRAVASMFLKIANIMHPILNTLGIAATLPAVSRQMLRQAGESEADFLRRAGPMSDYLDADKATISPHKLLQEAWHLFWHSPDDYAKAAELGYLEANMLEELNKLNNLKPSGFMDAMEKLAKYSDFINTPYNAMMKRSGRAVSAPTLSERSEVFTRAIAHMAGLAIVKNAGRPMTEEAQHAFAYWFANQNIADFAPNIRGEVFRGTGGIPFGLFQSYSINMLQRLFGYVENRQHRALAIQMFTQTAIFGAQGLPGWEVMNSYFHNLPDNKADERGATSLNERVYAAFGKGMGDLLMTGTVSNLPKLLGAESGINLWSSGDMNPRNPLSMPPAVSGFSQAFQGVVEGIKAGADEVSKFGTDKPSDPGRFLEIVSNYHLIRGHKSLADVVLGYKTDRRGNLVLDDTRAPAALLSRALGTKLTDELLLSGAYQENAAAQSQRVEKFAKIRRSMLGALRDGELTPEAASAYMMDYLLEGGQEKEWKQFLNYSIEMANDEKAARALGLLMDKGGMIFGYRVPKVERLLNAGATQPNK